VVLVCRNQARGEQACVRIHQRTPEAKVTLRVADLSSQPEIRSPTKFLRPVQNVEATRWRTSFRTRSPFCHSNLWPEGDTLRTRRKWPTCRQSHGRLFFTYYAIPELPADIRASEGKARNKSSSFSFQIERPANLRGMSLAAFAAQTTQNAQGFFEFNT